MYTLILYTLFQFIQIKPPSWTNIAFKLSHISRRTFQINVNGTLSQMAEAISGVPEGSVIGSVLFVIYVNALPHHLSEDSLLYADHAKLIALRNRHGILQNFLNVSASWSKDWELDLNPTKSDQLPIGRLRLLTHLR